METTSAAPGAPCNVDAECGAGACTQSRCEVLTPDGGATVSVDSPLDGALLAQARPSVRGKATAGELVSLSVDGQASSSVTAAGSSDFELTPGADLTEGAHTLTVSLSNGVAVTRSVTIDTLAPEAPVVLSPADDEVVGTTSPSLTGTAAEGLIEVFIDGNLIGSSTLDAELRWRVALLPEQALARGPHTLVARATDAAGNFAETTTGFQVGRMLNDPTLKVGCACGPGDVGLGSWAWLAVVALLRRRNVSTHKTSPLD